MRYVIVTLLICSATMSALALVYMAITPLSSKRYSAKSRYYAWLIIVLGFIIPFRPQFQNPIVRVEIPIETISPVVQIGNETQVVITEQIAPPTMDSLSISWWHIAAIVWIIGMIVVFVYHIIKHYRFMKMIRRWSTAVTDENAIALLLSLKSGVRIKQQVDLLICSCIGSPMLVGFVKPKILIPHMNFADDELGFILKHELIHLGRKDLWYKLFVMAATAIHWFNPVVYLMAKAINAQCELSCDAEVVRSINQDMRLHYSETIIGVVRYQSKMKTAFSTNFYGGKKGMKKRISSIMDTGRKRAGLSVVCVALVVTLGTGAAFAANARVDKSQAIGNINVATSEKVSDKSQEYEAYKQYGLTYDKATDSLYYNGTLVRYFKDNSIIYNGDSTIKGSVIEHTSTNGEGEIDIYAVRNYEGKLKGIRVADQDEYNNTTTLGESMSGTIRKYSEFGLKVNAIGKMYFEGYLVRELYDAVTGQLVTESIGAAFPEDSIDVIVVYRDGKLAGLRKATQEEYDMRTQERIENVQEYWVEKQAKQ